MTPGEATARIRIKHARFIESDEERSPSIPPWCDEGVWVDLQSRRNEGWRGTGPDGRDIETRRFYFDTTAEADAFMAGIFMGFECEVAGYGGGAYDDLGDDR